MNDLRRGLDALLAAAVGTLAGIVADSGFTVRDSLLDPLYRLLGPVFDLFSAFPNAQLVAAGVIDRLPIVLIVGFGLGMLLRQLRYPRLLLCAIPIWPLCAIARRLASPEAAGSLVAEAAIYLMQYALLILVIRWTHALLLRNARKPRT
jgi:hypothetical protein